MRARLALGFAMLAWDPASAQDRGAALYAEHCATCHQADGYGVPYFQPSLRDSAIVAGPPDWPIRYVLQGSDARDPAWGESDYDNVMPAFAALTDEQIAALVSFVRARFGGGAGPVAPDRVAAVRAELARDR